ncbi:MAG: hypothetical protein D6819_09880 [Gammaproteobacteria bacterium]|nr:MAG: hypothetical protein D6819_09880 [Gammaproteobacteria bacterium]
MKLELLANTRQELQNAGTPAYREWRWQDWAAHARGEICGQGEKAQKKLTELRGQFLAEHALHNPNRRNQGPAKTLGTPTRPFREAGLQRPLVDVAMLTPGSVRVRLDFWLLTPLITRDDDPFYLFDNPVRKERVFGLPHLAAASVKGLALDAFRRSFPKEVQGQDHPAQDRAYRLALDQARRLFGISSDGDEASPVNERGRVHWGAVWFEKVQYLVMNPMDPDTGTGTLPIQFEAIAPEQKSAVECFYFNPLGHKPATALMDMAELIAALSTWWPVLGLGAKRRAGYGALQPTGAEVHIHGEGPQKLEGEGSWRNAASYLRIVAL